MGSWNPRPFSCVPLIYYSYLCLHFDLCAYIFPSLSLFLVIFTLRQLLSLFLHTKVVKMTTENVMVVMAHFFRTLSKKRLITTNECVLFCFFCFTFQIWCFVFKTVSPFFRLTSSEDEQSSLTEQGTVEAALCDHIVLGSK